MSLFFPRLMICSRWTVKLYLKSRVSLTQCQQADRTEIARPPARQSRTRRDAKRALPPVRSLRKPQKLSGVKLKTDTHAWCSEWTQSRDRVCSCCCARELRGHTQTFRLMDGRRRRCFDECAGPLIRRVSGTGQCAADAAAGRT